ncbi:MAG: hypothetical protein ACYS30_25255 [Planctomycetota bacterium]|jgi:hypothetical protein
MILVEELIDQLKERGYDFQVTYQFAADGTIVGISLNEELIDQLKERGYDFQVTYQFAADGTIVGISLKLLRRIG